MHPPTLYFGSFLDISDLDTIEASAADGVLARNERDFIFNQFTEFGRTTDTGLPIAGVLQVSDVGARLSADDPLVGNPVVVILEYVNALGAEFLTVITSDERFIADDSTPSPAVIILKPEPEDFIVTGPQALQLLLMD